MKQGYVYLRWPNVILADEAGQRVGIATITKLEYTEKNARMEASGKTPAGKEIHLNLCLTGDEFGWMIAIDECTCQYDLTDIKEQEGNA